MRIIRLLTLSFITTALLNFAPTALAAPGSVELLRQAYITLGHADHDYKGHRAEAMKQIEAAAHELGSNIRGDGRGHEKQGVSDEQLRAAQGLLQQASVGLTGKPLKHVRAAEKQIETALKIK